MKTSTIIFFLFTCSFSTAYSQNTISTNQNIMEQISTIGIFDGEIVAIGNFETEKAYKINEYCINLIDLPEAEAIAFKGKKILVTGKLKTVIGKYKQPKTSTDGKIYEPYKEPDRKFITNPTFTIVL